MCIRLISTSKEMFVQEYARGVCILIKRLTKDMLHSMNKDAGENGFLSNEKGEFFLKIDGVATAINFLIQIYVIISPLLLLFCSC
ncbi:hypothetical protein Bca4012_064172 [Brassica carinata]